MNYYQDLEYLLSTYFGRLTYAQWKENALEVVSQDGLVLKDQSEWWTNDREIVKAAICQNPLAIRYAPSFQNDKAIALTAVRINGLARFWLNPKLQKDDLISKIASQNMPKMHIGYEKNKMIFLPYNRCKQLRDIQSDFFYNKFVHIELEMDECTRFIRDSHVNLFENGHLIPYPIKDPLYHHHFQATLPLSARHFLIHEKKNVLNSTGLTGKGFFQLNVEQAMITDFDHHISFKIAKSCIEGGNCFLFYSKKQKKVVIGELSLYLSMVALEEQGFFDKMTIEEDSESPSMDSLRMARNLDFYFSKKKGIEEKKYIVRLKSLLEDDENTPPLLSIPVEKRNFKLEDIKKELDQLGGELGYRKQLLSPLTEEEKVKFYEEGKRIDKKIKMTKSLISEELNIPLEHIAFIPQSKFHIDMEMFITPKGEVILHDDFNTENFLQTIQQSYFLEDEEQELLNEYLLTAKEEVEIFKELQRERIKILNKCEIPYQLFPAIFKAKSQKSYLNYCNGIFVKNGLQYSLSNSNDYGIMKSKGYSYITTGPSKKTESVFHNEFENLFKRIFPKDKLQAIPNMSKFLAECDGGIHCLTFESSM